MGRERIMAIDPGEMTGWATGYIEDGELVVEKSGYHPWVDFVVRLHERMVDGEPEFDTIVYESWRLRKSSAMDLIGSDLQSSQCIGAIKLAAWIAQKNGYSVRVRNQEPAIKNIIDSMKGGTSYLPKSDKMHPKDAVRHLWYYGVTERKVKP